MRAVDFWAMSLQETINEAYKNALKSGDATRKTTLSGLRAAIKNAEINLRGSGAQTLDADAIQAIINKEAKKRRESIVEFEKGNREDLATIERAELEVLGEFLPQQLSENELKSLIEQTIAQSGASGAKDMGRVMGALRPQIAGKADGKLASEMVKSLLVG